MNSGKKTFIGSIIGSFRKYYDEIVDCITFLELNNQIILSPKKSMIVDDRDGFVILDSDDKHYSDLDIQTIVFHRLFRSDYVYVWNPNGYIGKTTCYEIGRVTEHNIPIYYLEYPKDIPLYVTEGSVIDITSFVDYVKKNQVLPPYKGTLHQPTKTLIDDLNEGKYIY